MSWLWRTDVTLVVRCGRRERRRVETMGTDADVGNFELELCLRNSNDSRRELGPPAPWVGEQKGVIWVTYLGSP